MDYTSSFKIKTERFEGPLDLLLNLIEKRKLHINDISLSQVTDDYIKYVESQEDHSIGQTSHFILIASTLLLIKSKSLLPTLDLTPEETSDINDLETRLKIYKRIKEASESVALNYGKNTLYAKKYNPVTEVRFTPSSQIHISTIEDVVLGVIKALPKIEKIPKAIVKKVISLEEMMTRLTKRIQSNINMSFKEFSKTDSANKQEVKVNVIVSFLAMLELVKQGGLKVRQEGRFDDIHMETSTLGVPSYE